MKEKSYVEDIDRSIYDIRDVENDAYRMKEGLTPEIIDKLSKEKGDPVWMQQFRLQSLQIYNEMPIPDWGPSIEGLDMDHIATYVRPKTSMQNDWKNVPQDIKDTFERLGIPEAERKSLAGVGAQYDSELVYHNVREEVAAANYNYNYDFLDGIDQGDPTRLEGFLFPDTYEFYVGMQASSAINKLLENFHYRITDDMLTRMQNMGLDIRSVVNIASLIEREAANDNERGTIASVIYNRLAANMPLGIDASILYIHPDHEGSPTADMLAEDSPYNTRLYQGLPPTPIANPGLASIEAVLSPESTNYYYYALDTATGLHRFFTNSGEFDAFVATQNYD